MKIMVKSFRPRRINGYRAYQTDVWLFLALHQRQGPISSVELRRVFARSEIRITPGGVWRVMDRWVQRGLLWSRRVGRHQVVGANGRIEIATSPVRFSSAPERADTLTNHDCSLTELSGPLTESSRPLTEPSKPPTRQRRKRGQPTTESLLDAVRSFLGAAVRDAVRDELRATLGLEPRRTG